MQPALHAIDMTAVMPQGGGLAAIAFAFFVIALAQAFVILHLRRRVASLERKYRWACGISARDWKALLFDELEDNDATPND